MMAVIEMTESIVVKVSMEEIAKKNMATMTGIIKGVHFLDPRKLGCDVV